MKVVVAASMKPAVIAPRANCCNGAVSQPNLV